jgi:hypothetical protein
MTYICHRKEALENTKIMDKTLSANSSQSGGSNKSMNVRNIFQKCIDLISNY